MLPLLLFPPHFFLNLLLRLLIGSLLLLLLPDLPIPVFLGLGGVDLLISAVVDLDELRLGLLLLLLHTLHALEDFLVVVALVGDAIGLVVAVVL